ncbi:MAG: toprim domain-containing protein, partial [Opitutales bacterium]
PRLTVVLDGDNAGKKAALRMLPLALAAGHEVHFALLPTGHDPDSYLREEGTDAFRTLLEEAVPAFPYASHALLPDDPAPADLAAVVGELARILASCESEVARWAYFEEAIAPLPLEAGAARRDFEAHLSRLLRRPAAARAQAAEPPRRESPARADRHVNGKLTNAEKELVSTVLHHERLGSPLAEVLDPAWIDYGTSAGRLLGWLLGELAEGHRVAELEPRGALEHPADSELFFQLLAAEEFPLEPFEFANAQLRALYKRHLDDRLRSLSAEIANLEGDFDRQRALLAELAAVRRQRASNQVPALRPPEPSTD